MIAKITWHPAAALSMSTVLSLACMSIAAGADAPQYQMRRLSVAGATSVSVFDINAAGQAVGTYQDADFVRHAVLWDADGTAHELARIPGVDIDGIARAINDSGQIVGTSADFESGTSALLWNAATPTQYTIISSVPAEAATPNDINDAGVVVGGLSGFQTGVPSHAFVWTAANGLVDYGVPDPAISNQQARWSAVNASGALVGYWNAGFTTIHATRGQLGTPTVPPMSAMTEDFPTIAASINAAGTSVGLGLAKGTPKLVPVVFAADGTYSEIPGATLAQDNGAATAINADGVIVGNAGIGSANGIVPGLQAFVHVDGVSYDLFTISGDLSDFSRFSSATAINDAGQIVGTGRLIDDSLGSFVLTPVAADAIFANGFDAP